MEKFSPAPESPTRSLARQVITERENLDRVTEIDPAALDKIESNPQIVELLAQIAEARQQGNSRLEQKLVKQNRELRLELAGNVDNGEEARESERQQKLSEIRLRLTGQESEEELLRQFQMYTPEGTVTIESPLFADLTKRAFRQYLRTVQAFDELSYIEEMAGTRLKNVGAADKERLEMHNMTAALVSEDLGLGFDEARRLVAKMREELIPGSSEEARYGLAARRALKLAERYGYDAEAFMQDEKARLERVIHPEEKSA